jgi:hypothetical protein
MQSKVSTQGQDLEQQRIALGQIGCQHIFEEKVSWAKRDRGYAKGKFTHFARNYRLIIIFYNFLLHPCAWLRQMVDHGSGRPVSAGIYPHTEYCA